MKIFKKIHKYIKFKKEFNPIKLLGSGKDGDVYLCLDKKDKKKYVVKALSPFGKQYLPSVEHYISKGVESKFIYNIKIINKNYISYEYEDLFQVKADAQNYLSVLMQISTMQKYFLLKGVYYWDLGFMGHTNFLINSCNDIKLIDYGGNSFLFVDDDNLNLDIAGKRKNLLGANENFAKLQFLLHLYYFALGRKTSENFASSAQFFSQEELKDKIVFISNELRETYLSFVISVVKNESIFSSTFWDKIYDLSSLEKKKMINIQENADINKIIFEKDRMVVDGYQSFEISNNKIFPQVKKNQKLWDTNKKFEIVDFGLKLATKGDRVNSFLDIGSNLGLYVFLSGIKYKINKCVGVDYNDSYVKVCNDINIKLNLDNCFFEKKLFSEINGEYDVVLAMGLIHHLFQRTENFGNLDDIMFKFSEMTNKYLIIEFPTEKDSKASKWTNMSGRPKDSEYSLSLFIKISKKYFKNIKKIGKIKTRNTYIMKKK